MSIDAEALKACVARVMAAERVRQGLPELTDDEVESARLLSIAKAALHR